MRRRYKMDLFLVLWIAAAVSSTSAGLVKDTKELSDVLKDLHTKIQNSGEAGDLDLDNHDLDAGEIDQSIDTKHTNLHNDLHTNLHHDLRTNPLHDIHTNPHNDIHTNPHHDLHTDLRHDLHTNPHHDLHTDLRHNLHTNPHQDLHTDLRHDLHTNPHHDLRHDLHTNPHHDLPTDLHHNLHHQDLNHKDLQHNNLHPHDIDKGRLHDLVHNTLPQYNHDHNCKHNEMVPQPSNCSRFYHCSYGNLYINECPKGLMFSTNTTRCEYPEDANCTDNIVREKTCKMGELLPNPHNCSAFYECVLNGEKKLMSCPKYLQWCDRLKRCEYPHTAKCIETPGPIDGRWTDWGKWRHCTATCGHGFQVRRRNCTNPAPAKGGSPCMGEEFDSRECPDIPSCEEVSDKDRVRWTAWADCSTTCGHGTRVRHRKCISQRTHKLLGDYLNCNENEFESQECPDLPHCEDYDPEYTPR